MFFAKPGIYEACGIFSKGHIVLFTFMIIGIWIALYYTNKKSKDEVQQIIKNCTIFLWILEIIKILFNIVIGNINNPNSYIPLYYCSLILYAGLFSSFSKGMLKRVGDIFIATGGIVAGIWFTLAPLTSLTVYPVFHYISIQSFILHGTMIYLGLLVNITHYVEYGKKDFKYYFWLIIAIGILAYIVNLILDTNLMFISKNYPGTPIEVLYNFLGKLYPYIAILSQAIIPFFVILELKENISFSRVIKKIQSVTEERVNSVD